MKINIDRVNKKKKNKFNFSKLKPSKSIIGIILLFLGSTLFLGGIIYVINFDPIPFLQAMFTAAKVSGILISTIIFIICGASFLNGDDDMCINFFKN
jgi:hypothetical protein